MGFRLQVKPPAGKLRRANESEYKGEHLLREATLGNYSETNQKKAHKRPGLGPRQRSGGQEQEQTEQGRRREGVCDHL